MRIRTRKKDKAKKWLIVGAVIVGVSMLLFVGQYAFTFWLQHKLEKSVAQQTEGVYKLQLYGMETSPFIGMVSVDSLALTPDHDRWQHLQKQHKDVSRTLIEINTKAISLHHLNFFKMIFRKKIDLDSMAVQQPALLITAVLQDTTAQHKPLHETVNGFLKNMRIGKIYVSDANFRYRASGNTKKDMLALNKFNLIVDDYQLDSASFRNNQRAYYSKNMVLRAKSALVNLPNNQYRLTTDSVTISMDRKLFTASKILFQPTLSPPALSRAKGRAATYTKIEVPVVTISGLNFHEHSRNNNFIARHLLINKPSVSAFKDKKNFKNRGSQPLPHDLAQSVKAKFLIDNIEIRNGYTRYEELGEKATETGHVYFSNINGSISNLTNMPKRMSRKKPAIVKASAQIMGKARMQATVKIPLLDKNGYHTLEGHIGEGRPQILNPLLVPSNLIKVDKGYVRDINFRVTLNRNQAIGSMRALYNNLEIELLSAGAGEQQSLGKKILSKAADWLLIENSNPDSKGQKPRIGKIQVSRDQKSSFITYWKDCLASGLMASMGLEKMADKKF